MQKASEGIAGKLAAQVDVEDLRLMLAQCLLQGINAEVGIQGIGSFQGKDQANT